MGNHSIYHRPDLADRLAAMLLGDDPLSSAGRSGLFLSAPRRTGKSTFLRNDLVPAVEKAGAVVVYVDLWADKNRDPGELIADAVRDALAQQASKIRAGIEAVKRVRKAGVKGEWQNFKAEFGFELETIGQSSGATLAKAFEALHQRAKRPIVFILDEAQHALSSERGADTLFALKAARDALNVTAEKPQLAIIATGSARGKIADLVMRKNQAFYGASTETFPPLGEPFLRHFVRTLLAARLGEDNLPSVGKLSEAFQVLGRRPEDLRQAIRNALLRPEEDLGDAIVAAAHLQRDAILLSLRNQLDALNPLQRAILKRMVKKADSQLFSRESIDLFRNEAGNARISSRTVQKATDDLVKDGFVWRSSRGVYALDDAMIAEFFFDGQEDSLLAQLEAPK